MDEKCIDGLEHDIQECPNCNFQFCDNCGEVERELNKVQER